MLHVSSIRNRTALAAAALATTALFSAAAQADYIGINLTQQVRGTTVTAGSTVGPLGLSSSNWNNVTVTGSTGSNTGTTSNLIDGSGSHSSASVTVTGNDMTGVSITHWTSPSTGDTQLWSNVMETNGSGTEPPITVTLTNVPYSSYDVYVFAQGGNTTSTYYFSIADQASGTTVYSKTDDSGGSVQTLTGWTPITSQSSSSPSKGNYAVFSETSSSDLITISTPNASSLTVPGIEIVDTSGVPEPATLGLLSLGALAFLRRRRRCGDSR